MSIFSAFGAAVGAARSALEALSSLVHPLAGSLSAALAVVLFTLLVRLAISPLSYLRIRSARRRAALAPRLAALREKHAGDPATLAAETLALHRANGISPFAGILPSLLQWPFFLVMYRVAGPAPAGAVFGVPLSAHLAAGLPVFGVLLAVAAIVAWWSARRLTEGPPLLRVLPFLTVLTVAWLPLAAGLYLVTSAAWTVFEQGWGQRPV